jgi:hypothetical protein
MGSRSLSRGVKRPGRGAEHPPLSRAAVQYVPPLCASLPRNGTALHLYCIHQAVYDDLHEAELTVPILLTKYHSVLTALFLLNIITFDTTNGFSRTCSVFFLQFC